MMLPTREQIEGALQASNVIISHAGNDGQKVSITIGTLKILAAAARGYAATFPGGGLSDLKMLQPRAEVASRSGARRRTLAKKTP